MSRRWYYEARNRAADDRSSKSSAEYFDILAVLREEKGLICALMPMDDQISGLILISEHAGIIVINSSKSLGHQRFTMAHEYYHWKYQKSDEYRICNIDKNSNNDEERAANSYASYLLLPEELLIKELSREINETDEMNLEKQVRIGQKFGVSHSFLQNRLKILKVGFVKTNGSIVLSKLASDLGLDPKLYKATNIKVVYHDIERLAEEKLNEGVITEGYLKEILNKAEIETIFRGDVD